MPFLSASGVSPYNKIRGGGSALVVPFAFENALEFDGVNDYVNFTQTASLPNYTVSAWFKPDVFNKFFMSNDNSFSNAWMRFSTLMAFRDVTGAKTGNFSFPALSLNAWHHFILVGTGGSAKLFVDGVESTSGAQALGNMQFSNLGRSASSANTHFNGVIDETAIWTSALTDTQAINQYNSGAGNFANADVEPLIWYKLNETDAATTALNSGSGGATYNGTLNNFTLPGAWVPHNPALIDPMAAAFIAAHDTESGLTMSATQINSCNNLALRLKGIGTPNETNFITSDLVYNLYPYAPSDNSNFSFDGYKLNFYDPSIRPIAYSSFVSGDIDNIGIKGGAGKKANTAFNANTIGIGRDDFSAGFWADSVTTNLQAPFGLVATGSVQLVPINGNYYVGVNSNLAATSVAPVTGLTWENRRSSSEIELYYDATIQETRASTSASPANGEIYFHSRNNGGSVLSALTTKASFFFFNKGLTPAQAVDWSFLANEFQSTIITGGR